MVGVARHQVGILNVPAVVIAVLVVEVIIAAIEDALAKSLGLVFR